MSFCFLSDTLSVFFSGILYRIIFRFLLSKSFSSTVFRVISSLTACFINSSSVGPLSFHGTLVAAADCTWHSSDCILVWHSLSSFETLSSICLILKSSCFASSTLHFSSNLLSMLSYFSTSFSISEIRLSIFSFCWPVPWFVLITIFSQPPQNQRKTGLQSDTRWSYISPVRFRHSAHFHISLDMHRSHWSALVSSVTTIPQPQQDGTVPGCLILVADLLVICIGEGVETFLTEAVVGFFHIGTLFSGSALFLS